MIYEMRTYDLEPRSVDEVERRFCEAYEYRKQYSKIAAFWHTEIGPLNQIVQVWPYEDLEERARIRAAAARDDHWPPKIGEFVVRQQSDIMAPFDISPELKPGNMGPYFEMRTYIYRAGELPVIMKTWKDAIEYPLQYMPVCAIWFAELGELNKFVHIWPYRSLDERAELRRKSHATGMWPPWRKAVTIGGRDYKMVSQDNKILVAASFSPLH